MKQTHRFLLLGKLSLLTDQKPHLTDFLFTLVPFANKFAPK